MSDSTRSRAGAYRPLLADLIAPLLVFYGLRAAGAPDVVALAAGAVPPAGSAVRTAVRDRRVEPLALLVLAGGALSTIAALLAADPRAMLVRGAWLSLPFSVITLVSLRFRRPLTFTVMQAMLPGRADLMDELWETSEHVRRAFRGITVLWGVTAIVDAGLHLLMAVTLPVAVVPALDTALTIATVLALQVPTHVLLWRSGAWNQLFNRHQRRTHVG